MREIHKPKSAIRHLAKLPAVAALFGAMSANAAPIDEVKLAPVEVKADVKNTKDTDKTYNAPVTRVGRTPQAARDIPQSTTSITKLLMADQDSNSLKEALRNAVGITFNASEGGSSGDGVRVRGFGASNDLYLDNFRDAAQYNRDTFNTDTVEVLRGPASMIYGRGSTGGIINQVSKTPFRGDLNQFTASAGTANYYRAEADLNRSLEDNAAFRVNVMGQKSGSTREGAEMNRWGFAPSVAFGLGEQTEVTLSYMHYQEDNVPDYGVPYYRAAANGKQEEIKGMKGYYRDSISGSDQPIPYADKFYGLKDFDSEVTETDVFSFNLQHRLNANMLLKNSTRIGLYELDLRASAPGLAFAENEVLNENTVITRGRKLRMREQAIYSNVTDLLWDFETGTVRHNVLAGVEFTRENLLSTGRTQLDAKGGNCLPSTTVGNPTSGSHEACLAPVKFATADSTADTMAFYAQDLIELTPQWKVLAGARFDHFKAQTENKSFTAAAPSPDAGRTDNIWSWRTGVIYQPTANQSYYASYGTSFNPSAEAYSTDPKNENLDPEKNRNMEIGAKWTLLDGDLSLRTAIFRTEKTNERQTDIEVGVNKPNVLSGRRHTDGIELEGAGRITADWQVFAGIALMNPRIDEVTKPKSVEGNYAENAPRYTGNLWSTYQLNSNWKVGGGFNAMDKRYTSNTNTVNLPAYIRWDAMAEWRLRDYSVQLNVNNLFDTDHFESLYAGFAVPGTGRTARVSASYRF
ncbi:TonB-dependent siderophore receptor [Iodobacter sp. HSC-16F04]|uniref:TonB-dependent siderophore receptor n=1 Tax=Iodobacter violaceini TaxID=3044271 RepID=A0ABX0KUE3_9NEIS|nr:TonB-dependent siderophore receptor [Iodobacter violacea]NHQ86308.1 TonB-dependent siderophore receptor [Iodobacter violacea]